ncbi:MAG TPA: BTAD domain-containing putative transcriptional regulator [Acetobacteraceae bacterium]|nr:BTAD domain-containing putative transcriptional regulator [Acetobacteraceae bacterium]
MAGTTTRPTGLAAQPSPSGQVVLRLRLIGQMEAWTITSENVLPAGRKTRALLAVVALSAPRPALRGRLAELLWSRRPEEQARASLRQEIHRLLETLSPAGTEIMQVTRDHLSLKPGVVWVDVEEVMRATTDQPASLSLLDGDLLEDLEGIDPTFDAWLTTERERLRDRARNVAEALLRESSEPEAAIPAAQRLLQIDRAHEGAWRALMRAHVARGERGMAIQAYDRCRAVLADLLDAAPSQETQKLLAEIRGPYGSRVPVRAAPAPVLPPVEPAPPPPADDLVDDEPVAVLEPRPENRPSRGGAHVGVMPMQFPGATDEDTHLAPGLAEEITTALSRFRWMFVVSSSSLTRFATETRDENAIRRTFGIDFLVDGSIQRVRNRLRITVRLLDLRASNQVVWARRFDRQSNDLLSLQDEIAAEVVAQIDPEILLIEARRSAARPPVDATAYDLVLRAIPLMWRMERAPFMQAGSYLARAIEVEPDYAAAHAWYAYWHVFLVGQGWAEDPAKVMAAGGALAERAIVLDPFDARALTIAGHVRAFLHRRQREALALHERALSLNPNLAMAWALSACAYAYLGEPEEAERRNNRYKRLSPLDPHAFFYDTFFLYIHLLKRDFESTIAVGRSVCEMNPSFTSSHKLYLVALGHTGRMREAAAVRERLLMLEPDFSVQQFLASTPLVREVDRDLFAEGLRLAGLREHASDLEETVVAP